MEFFIRRAWDVPEGRQTSAEVYEKRNYYRREFLKAIGAGTAAVALLPGCRQPTDAEIERAGAVQSLPELSVSIAQAKRNSAFTYGRPETEQRAAAEYTNFYEFSRHKDNWRYVEHFQPHPWEIAVEGLCRRPTVLDLDDLHRKFSLEERAYRFRCVETWAMCIPWRGFPLRDLLRLVEPSPKAKYVAFETFHRPDEASNMKADLAGGTPQFPWPYTEGLTIDEATNELTFLAVGVYGEPLPKQHGAPIRLVLPWKYGYKSIKSIVKITLTDERPPSFWNIVAPQEYGFRANVDPDVPHPRWSQRTEWMLGTGERYETIRFNGYGEYVANLYQT